MNPAEQHFGIDWDTLKASDVLSKPDTPQTKPMTEKLTSFTLKLNPIELAKLVRAADAVGKSWKEYFTEEIKKQFFQSNIGKPVIRTTSGGIKKVTGPSDPSKYQELLNNE